jgi:hypothetical protein
MEGEAKDAELRKRKASKTETEDKGSSSGDSSKKEVEGDASERALMQTYSFRGHLAIRCIARNHLIDYLLYSILFV